MDLELLLVQCDGLGGSKHPLHMHIQVSRHHLLEVLSFLQCLSLESSLNITWL